MKQLQYLIALADARHFGRAAEVCAVTQSTLSAGIRDLESVLGTEVAERSKRRVVMTRLGGRVAEMADEILREAEAIMALARADPEPMTGEIRLGVIPTISPFLLPRVLPVLRERFPRLLIYLREERTAGLLAGLEHGDLDLVLIALPYETGDLTVDVVGEDEFLFACRRDHALAGTSVVTREALAGAELLLLEEGHCLRGHTLDVCRIGDVRARAQFEASSLHTLVQMVAAGIGVTLIPRLAVDADISRGADISLTPLAVPASRQLGLAWRQTSTRVADYRLLAETLRGVLGT
ncbi:MAG: hydrogen peroxide-inducible genes activator [Gammaproteobacteria bacterium]|nr:hydrogen peroxide-inducible genes activator [Gammaproteobacteria bacterium]